MRPRWFGRGCADGNHNDRSTRIKSKLPKYRGLQRDGVCVFLWGMEMGVERERARANERKRGKRGKRGERGERDRWRDSRL